MSLATLRCGIKAIASSRRILRWNNRKVWLSVEANVRIRSSGHCTLDEWMRQRDGKSPCKLITFGSRTAMPALSVANACSRVGKTPGKL